MGPEECFDKPHNALISRAWPLPDCGKVSSAQNLSISFHPWLSLHSWIKTFSTIWALFQLGNGGHTRDIPPMSNADVYRDIVSSGNIVYIYMIETAMD